MNTRVYVGNLKGGEYVHGSVKVVCTFNVCGGWEGTRLIPWNYEDMEVPETIKCRATFSVIYREMEVFERIMIPKKLRCILFLYFITWHKIMCSH
jgi:hypothetical protein